MIILCEECLVYAVCRQKRYIECETLYKKLREGVKGDIIMKCFPNWVDVIWRPNDQTFINHVFKVDAHGNYRISELIGSKHICMVFIDGNGIDFESQVNVKS